MPLLRVDQLSATLGQHFALEAISFGVEPGARLAVVGPNGSGKTSLLRLLGGFEAPTGGTIAWSDEPLSCPGKVLVPPEARATSVLFQEGALFAHLDVGANVALGLPPGTSRADAEQAVRQALGMARVSASVSRSVAELSGGEQQRVALARALVRRPRLLLLDEPFHSLDGATKREILVELRAMVARERMAAILVTHETSEAAAFADELLVLRSGRAIARGRFADLYAAPVDLPMAALLGPVEQIEAARARAQGVELPAGWTDDRVAFRPEQLRLSPAASDSTTRARVVEVRCEGMVSEVTIALGDGSELRARLPADQAPAVGAYVAPRIMRSIGLPSGAASSATGPKGAAS